MQPFKYRPKINSGNLRNWIAVYGRTKIKNEINQTTYIDKLKLELWAEIIPQTGSLQKKQADTLLSNVTHKIIVRYAAGSEIEQSDYITYRGKRFDIKYILNPYFNNETLEIFVEEVLG